MDRLSKVKKFIQENYYDGDVIQLFDSRNLVGDYMETVYDDDGITIDYCPGYHYLEVFGLTNEEYLELIDSNKLHSKVKVFEEGIDY